MQTSHYTRQLEMGIWMLNMQFNADKGLVLSIKSPKINNIDNLNIRCFPNVYPFVSFEVMGYSILYIRIRK